MKQKYLLIGVILFFATIARGQDFGQNLGAAKASYSAGNLADAHFSLEQAIQELDIIVGKEILTLLPKEMSGQAVLDKEDQVTANVGFIGATIHREYGDKGSQVEIISNSPMIATLNSILNMPLIGGMMRDENTKVMKVNGYKCRLEKDQVSAEAAPSYTLQIPLKSALITITGKDMDEKKILAFAQSIPIEKIAAMIQ